jgi:hypothetical protein
MLSNGTTSIGTVATMIDGNSVMPLRLLVHNNDNTDAVYLGNKSVTTSNGYLLTKQQTLEIILNPLEELYGVSGKAGHVISWIRQTL